MFLTIRCSCSRRARVAERAFTVLRKGGPVLHHLELGFGDSENGLSSDSCASDKVDYEHDAARTVLKQGEVEPVRVHAKLLSFARRAVGFTQAWEFTREESFRQSRSRRAFTLVYVRLFCRRSAGTERRVPTVSEIYESVGSL